MHNFIDRSNNTIIIGSISFIFIFILVRYIFLEYNKNFPEDSENVIESKRILILSFFISMIITIVCLAIYTQYLINKGLAKRLTFVPSGDPSDQ
jgi:heme/copper-type cytochrome/quinol oxidase subunit 2